jgi:RNA:NAD 2'-phosphotransferase (TPT1/KptA family)
MSREGGQIKLSKALSWLLRHNAEKEGFTLLEGGFLPVADILKHHRAEPAIIQHFWFIN